MRPGPSLLPYVIAFVSGGCALVYEIVWTRVFTPVFGLSIHATTAVLCAFMAGLGAGSIAAPWLIRRWRRSPWELYVLLEIGIGVTALLIPVSVGPITRAYLAFAGVDVLVALTALVRFLLATLAMAIPTVLMGLTLPVLVHAFRTLANEDLVESRRMGLLYGINAVGGALGCVLVGFVLLYKLGVFATTAVTAATNFAVATTAFALFARREFRSTPPPAAAPSVGFDAPRATGRFASMSGTRLLLLYGLIGFAALGYELCWFRILAFYLQSATHSFSIMLALFLLGVGSGSAFFSASLERRLDAASADLRTVACVVQLLVAVLGASTLIVSTAIPSIWTWMIGSLGAGSWLAILFQKAVVASVVIFPTTFLFGISFPLVARLYKAQRVADSTTVGLLYGANTLGAILGTLLTGFVLFDRIGVQATIAALSVLSAAVGLGFFQASSASRRVQGAVGALAAVVAGLLVFTPPRLLIANFAKHTGKILFYQETAADVCFVHEGGGARVLAFGDGRGAAGSGSFGNYANRLLAYSAMMLNPGARKVLVISMGAGNTASAFAQFPIERLDIVDISEGPFEAARFFPTNLGVLEDPRVRTFVEDGRNFLLRSREKYDIIQLELPTLHTAGVVYLYTREFYEIARARLEERGVLSQWIDIVQTGRRVSYTLINTMLEVFPHSAVWTDNWSWWITGLRQEEPISISYAGSRELFSNARVQRDLQSVGSSYEDTLSKLWATGAPLESAVGNAGRITDDRTLADFLVPQGTSPTAFGGGVAYYTSPMAHVFRHRWQRDGAAPVRFRKPEFYPGEQQAEHVDQSMLLVAGEFPEDVLTRTRELHEAR